MTGSTTGQTLTLGTTSVVAGQTMHVKNNSSVTWTIAAASGTVDLTALNASAGAVFLFDGTNWNVVGYSGGGNIQIGERAAYNAVTSGFTMQPATTTTWYAAATTSGTAPSITLPNDGFTYRVVFMGSSFQAATASQVGFALATSASALLAACLGSSAAAGTNTFYPMLEDPAVVGSGQTISLYSKNYTGTGASYLITCLASSSGPSSIAAYRVL
jgi:hypothetical protein